MRDGPVVEGRDAQRRRRRAALLQQSEQAVQVVLVARGQRRESSSGKPAERSSVCRHAASRAASRPIPP